MFNAPTKESSTINLSDGSCDAGESLHLAANQAGRKVRSMLHSASDDITHASEYVTGEIRSHPVRSSAIALGAGMLLGALLRR